MSGDFWGSQEGCPDFKGSISMFHNEIVQFSSVAQSCPTLCDPMNRSMPGLPVHHQLLESTQTHVHRVGDTPQPQLTSPASPPTLLSMSIPLQPCQPFIPPTSLPWPQRLCPHGALLPGTLLPQRPTTPALLDTLLLGEAFSALSPAASQGLAQTRCLDVLLRVCQYRGLGSPAAVFAGT